METIASQRHEALIAAARGHYRVKCDAMLAALAACMPADVRWTRPQGGLFVWVTLPEGVDGAELLPRAVAEAGIAFVPGAAFHPDADGANTIRLSYSLPTPEAIREGTRRLAALLQAGMLRRSATGSRGYDIMVDCFNRGLVVRVTGDTIALSPPLIVERTEIDGMVMILGDAIKRVA